MTGESLFFFIEVLTLVQFCRQPIEAAITPFFVESSFHAMPVSLHCSLLCHLFMLCLCHCIVLCCVIFSCYACVIALFFAVSSFHAMPVSLHCSLLCHLFMLCLCHCTGLSSHFFMLCQCHCTEKVKLVVFSFQLFCVAFQLKLYFVHGVEFYYYLVLLSCTVIVFILCCYFMIYYLQVWRWWKQTNLAASRHLIVYCATFA